jgi:orotate phosphoribosyltransferase
MTPLRAAALEIVRTKAVRRFDEPVQLASGAFSDVFVDIKRGLARGADLRVVCEAMVEMVTGAGVDFDAAGGLTLGADQFAHGIAIVADRQWFVIRKQAKGRGTNQLVEGAELGPGVRVLLVEDAVTTGGSIRQAYEQVVEQGAEVVFALTTIDRGDTCAPFFAGQGVAYEPLFTSADLGLDPVSAG